MSMVSAMRVLVDRRTAFEAGLSRGPAGTSLRASAGRSDEDSNLEDGKRSQVGSDQEEKRGAPVQREQDESPKPPSTPGWWCPLA
jgi:hypothetical protein